MKTEPVEEQTSQPSPRNNPEGPERVGPKFTCPIEENRLNKICFPTPQGRGSLALRESEPRTFEGFSEFSKGLLVPVEQGESFLALSPGRAKNGRTRLLRITPPSWTPSILSLAHFYTHAD